MQSVVEWWGTVQGALLARPTWQVFLVVLAASLAAAWVVRVGGDALVRRVTRRIDGAVDDVVLGTVHPPLYVTVVLVGLYLAFDTLSLASGVALPVRAGLLSVLTVLWAVTLTRVGRRVSKLATDGEGFDREVVPIFQNVWTALVVGVTAFLLLSFWRVDVTPLLASAGILGIVVGFAARDTIANFFGSIALYADGTYAVGDYVILESGERGRVEDISIRSTVIRTRDDTLVTVPNAVLNSASIVNESTPRRERRIRLPVGVAYDSDLDHVEEVLLAVAAAETLVIERPAPRVRFRGFGDSAVDAELLCWVDDAVLRGRVTHALVKAVHAAFAEAGVDIPFPRRDLSFAAPTDAVAVADTPDAEGAAGGD